MATEFTEKQEQRIAGAVEDYGYLVDDQVLEEYGATVESELLVETGYGNLFIVKVVNKPEMTVSGYDIITPVGRDERFESFDETVSFLEDYGETLVG